MYKTSYNAMYKSGIGDPSIWIEDINKIIAAYNERIKDYERYSMSPKANPEALKRYYNELMGEWKGLANEILESGKRYGFKNIHGKVNLPLVPSSPENLKLLASMSSPSSRPIIPPSQSGPLSTNVRSGRWPVTKGIAITTALGLASALAAMLAKKYFDKSKTQSPGQIFDDQIPAPVVTKPAADMSSYIPPAVPYIAG
jgi:hypothetical protein